MEHLTKQQIILLALLVSFVSSIATGIVTVSLLDQATPAVSQTINRVVERTIERIGTSTPSASRTIETVIVKEDQAVIDAISKSSRSIVRLTNPRDGFMGLGLIISSSGRIVAHTGAEYSDPISATLTGGNVVAVTFVSRDPISGISVFQADQSSDPINVRAYTPAAALDLARLKLGQSVVIVGGVGTPVVAQGIISSINEGRIRTDVRDSAFDSQGILVTLLGEVIGLRDEVADGAFLSSDSIKNYATP